MSRHQTTDDDRRFADLLRATVDEHVDAAAYRPVPWAGLRPALRRRRLGGGLQLGVAVGLTTACAAGAAVVVTNLQAGQRPVTAAAALDERSAPYWYVRTRDEMDGAVWTREEWLGHEAPGRWLSYRAGGKDPEGNTTEPASWALNQGVRVDWDQLLALPTDPVQLEAWLRRQPGQPRQRVDDLEVFMVLETMGGSPAPPALRRAVYEVARGLPGVERLGASRDALGRSGQLLQAADATGTRWQFVVEPLDGRVLEERTVEKCGRTLCTTRRWTYLESGPVADTRTRLTPLGFAEPTPVPSPSYTPEASPSPSALDGGPSPVPSGSRVAPLPSPSR